MNQNVHFPDPSLTNQSLNPHFRRDDLTYPDIQAPPQGAYYHPQPYPHLQTAPRPNYPVLNGPYPPQGYQQLNTFEPYSPAADTQPRVLTSPSHGDYPQMSANPPVIVQQGAIYQSGTGYPQLPPVPNYNYAQYYPSNQGALNTSGFDRSIGHQESHQALIPVTYAQEEDPQSRVQQIENRIKGGFCCYNFLLYLGLIGWIFNVFVTFSGRGKIVFKVLEVLLSLVFLAGFILAIKARSSLTSRRQFKVFVIFTFVTLAQLVVSILSVPALGRKLANFHGRHGHHGPGGHNGYGGGHHGYGGHHGFNNNESEGRQYGHHGRHGRQDYGGYNGYHSHGPAPVKVILIVFMVILPFVLNVVLTCYARSLSKLMKERERLLHSFRAVNRLI